MILEQRRRKRQNANVQQWALCQSNSRFPISAVQTAGVREARQPHSSKSVLLNTFCTATFRWRP